MGNRREALREWFAASPERQANLPKIRPEPVLRARAEQLAPGRIRFHHELTGPARDDEGVTATVADGRHRHRRRPRHG